MNQFPPGCDDSAEIEGLLQRYGASPFPPSISRHDADDQTGYTSKPRSVAAFAAGLHLTDELLVGFHDKVVEIAYVTLLVVLGTFRPVEQKTYLISPCTANGWE